MSFAKMLKEKKYKPIVRRLATTRAKSDFNQYEIADFFVIKLEDECEWFWDNGGKEYAITHQIRYTVQSKLEIGMMAERAREVGPNDNCCLGAFCFLRAYETAVVCWGEKKGCEWVEAKIREMGK